jgi:hypothetical protein
LSDASGDQRQSLGDEDINTVARDVLEMMERVTNTLPPRSIKRCPLRVLIGGKSSFGKNIYIR